LDQALARISVLLGNGVGWFEELMITNEAPAHRRPLGSECPIQLAGGQNIPDRKDLEGCFNWFAFVQPDIGKWGDVDGCLDIARKAVAAGKTYYPH
jgi:D-galactarolactone cycloisomerase